MDHRENSLEKLIFFQWEHVPYVELPLCLLDPVTFGIFVFPILGVQYMKRYKFYSLAGACSGMVGRDLFFWGRDEG